MSHGHLKQSIILKIRKSIRDFLDKIFSSYEKAIKDENKEELEDSPWWTELRKEFQGIFLENQGLNKNQFKTSEMT